MSNIGIGKGSPGIPKSPEHRAKTSAANKGKVRSAQSRLNISLAHRGSKLSEEHKAHIKASAGGWKHSPEMCAHLSKINKGKHHSEEAKAKMRASHQRRWAGHISADPRRVEFYEVWRREVLKRDKRTCQRCGKVGGKLHAHHIKPWAAFPELRYEVSNGKTLCANPCHKDEHREMKGKE